MREKKKYGIGILSKAKHHLAEKRTPVIRPQSWKGGCLMPFRFFVKLLCLKNIYIRRKCYAAPVYQLEGNT